MSVLDLSPFYLWHLCLVRFIHPNSLIFLVWPVLCVLCRSLIRQPHSWLYSSGNPVQSCHLPLQLPCPARPRKLLTCHSSKWDTHQEHFNFCPTYSYQDKNLNADAGKCLNFCNCCCGWIMFQCPLINLCSDSSNFIWGDYCVVITLHQPKAATAIKGRTYSDCSSAAFCFWLFCCVMIVDDAFREPQGNMMNSQKQTV